MRLVSLLVVLLLTGCGFQLRGSEQLLERNVPLYLDTGNTSYELARLARLTLAQRQWPITEDPSLAKTRIELLSENSGKHQLSQYHNGQAAEYQLTYQLHYRIFSAGQDPIERRIRRQRIYLENREQLLGKAQEAERLLSELRIDAFAQLLASLSSIQHGTQP